LIVKLCFLPFFNGFHSANGNFCACDLVPPPIEPASDRVPVDRRPGAKLLQLCFPTLSMALFSFCHSQKDAFALFIVLAFREIAVRLRSFNFRLPVALRGIDRLLCS
jgi:hypothetical protein